ncbi:MAG: hypothetical protein J6Y02_14790 [Pseudobutyrivibrio sp.]|nr:hypothetical protein [Pseudobutyrivibrio sp.]
MIKMCSKCHTITSLHDNTTSCPLVGCDGTLITIEKSRNRMLTAPEIALAAWAVNRGWNIYFTSEELEEFLKRRVVKFSVEIRLYHDVELVLKYMEKYMGTHSSPIFKAAISGDSIWLTMEPIALEPEKESTNPGLSLLSQVACYIELFWNFVKEFCYGIDDYNI